MADNMLGTLAKWLRVGGADCDYAEGMDDDALVEVAASGRTVLTRDRLLAQRCGGNGLYIVSDQLEEQLLQVLRRMPDLMDLEPISRCLVCWCLGYVIGRCIHRGVRCGVENQVDSWTGKDAIVTAAAQDQVIPNPSDDQVVTASAH